MAAVKIVDYEEWKRRKAGVPAVPGAGPKGPRPPSLERPDRIVVDVSAPATSRLAKKLLGMDEGLRSGAPG
jgi:hypothetical protein